MNGTKNWFYRKGGCNTPRIFNTAVKLHELATLILSHSKLASSATPTLSAQLQHLPSPRDTGMQVELRGPAQHLQLPRRTRLGAKGFTFLQDADRGSTFSVTRVEGAPLTHSPACDLMKQGCWKSVSCKPVRGHLLFKFSAFSLHPAPPGELT